MSEAILLPVLRRYALFQLPELLVGGLLLTLLARLDTISSGVAWLLFALLISKEIALFPFVRRAYEPSSPMGGDALVGAIGRVAAPARIASAASAASAAPEHGREWRGRVQIGPELWNARLTADSAPVSAGSSVRVEAVEGLTLIVSAIESARRPPAG